jgi:hypothetical protein
VSRPIVVDAYAQLAGEGYLELHPGTRPRVTGCAGPCQPPLTRRADPVPEPRYDFRPGVPDLSAFPAPPGSARSARRSPGCGTPISATPIHTGPPGESLDGEDVVPGFALALAELFGSR